MASGEWRVELVLLLVLVVVVLVLAIEQIEDEEDEDQHEEDWNCILLFFLWAGDLDVDVFEGVAAASEFA